MGRDNASRAIISQGEPDCPGKPKPRGVERPGRRSVATRLVDVVGYEARIGIAPPRYWFQSHSSASESRRRLNSVCQRPTTLDRLRLQDSLAGDTTVLWTTIRSNRCSSLRPVTFGWSILAHCSGRTPLATQCLTRAETFVSVTGPVTGLPGRLTGMRVFAFAMLPVA